MPTQKELTYFREGLRVLHRSKHFVTLSDAIKKMMSVVSPNEEKWAKDAIARVLRHKQAIEMTDAQKYPQAQQELDQKYQDLYVLLKSIKLRVKSRPRLPQARPAGPPRPPQAQPQQLQQAQDQPQQVKQAQAQPQAQAQSQPQAQAQSQPQAQAQPQAQPKPRPRRPKPKSSRVSPWSLAKLSPVGGLETSLMIIDWIKSKKKTIVAGTAVVTTLGSVYWLYKHFTSSEKKENPDKETSFEKTINSIQKYRAFTTLCKDPDFSGSYEDLMSGNLTKKKGVKKKSDLYDKGLEWERKEQGLMRDMDNTFNALSDRPKIKYELPRLPESNSIDPKTIVFDKDKDKEEEETSLAPVKPKPTRNRKRKAKKSQLRIVDKTADKTSKKSSKKKVSRSKDAPTGRLIPIVKRTRRVKKVQA
jgi:hypothetical protein